MSDAERNALGITLAGKNQYRVLAAIMQNYAHAVEATEDAINSEGTAQQQNDAYMESLESRVTNLKALFQELSEMVVGSDLVGGFIDLAEGILTFANTDFGAFVTKVSLLFTAMSGIYGMLSAGILGGILPSLSEALPVIGIVVLGLLGIKEALDWVKKKAEEQIEWKAFDKVEEAIKTSYEKIKEYDTAIEEAKKKLVEINQIPWQERTSDILLEEMELRGLIQEYERLKQVEQERISGEYLKKLRKTSFSTGAYSISEMDEDILEGLSNQYANLPDVYHAIEQGLFPDYQTALLQLGNALGVVKESGESTEEVLEKCRLAAQLLGLVVAEEEHNWSEELEVGSEKLKKRSDLLEQYPSFLDDFSDSTKKLIDANKEYYDTLKIIEETGGNLSQQEKDFIKNYEDLHRSITKATVGAEQFNKAQEKAEEIFGKMGKKGSVTQLEQYVKALKEMGGLDDSGIISVIQDLSNLGIIDVDYLDDELTRILNKLRQIPETTEEINETGATVKVDADAEGIPEEVQEAMAEVEGQGITITSSADASALQESLQAVSQLIDTLNTKTLHVKVDSNVSEVMQSLNSLTSTINSLPSGSFSVYLNDYASSKLNSIYATYSKLKDKTITITTVYKQEGSGSGSAYAEGTDYFRGGQALINDGQPVNGSAAELVVANGRASIYNQGEPAIVNLPVGAKIYTAEETQDILHNIQSLKDSIPAFADGNVREPATINAETIQYDPSEYYSLNLPATITTPAAFEAWLKEKKHLLELDLITQEQYYLDLEYMNENYLKKMYNTQDDYWQYQEEVYKWKKEQVGDENALLKKQIELEKALGEVAKAKAQKILVFKNGKFQYMADTDAIDQAQKNLLQVQGKAYADGTLHATKGIHLVGEEGPELRVLNDGDGIIPANATKNLLDIAKMGVKGVADTVNKTLQTIYNFDISNLNLPNVENADEFFNGLKNYAYQYSYA